MRTPNECANVLAEIYRNTADGEQLGAYRVDREALKTITGRPVFHQTIIEDVADWLVEHGLILIDRDRYFVIMRPSVLDEIHEVPDDVLATYHHPVNFGGPYDN